jgi:hypothetical protein
MAERITEKFLQARIDTVNRLLGFDPETVRWNTVGTVQLYGAYGATAVHRVVNDAGGVSDLSGLGTRREIGLYLAGMIEALRITQGA